MGRFARILPLFIAGCFAVVVCSCGTTQPQTEKPASAPGGNEQSSPSPAAAGQRTSPPPAPVAETPVTPPSPPVNPPAGPFTVQIGAYAQQESAQQIAGSARARFPQSVGVALDPAAGLYKVTIGSFTSKDDARRFRDSMVQQFPTDYKDAWVSEIPPK
ncbi:MAG TPA: SPOR domain-containing protein [Bacteroidota bacterium]|nr:SPOR domain-containing protein [Bacteroidota bacterium]